MVVQQTRRLLAYRADFWLHAVASFSVHLVLASAVWKAVFAAGGAERIGGLDYPGMVTYYVVAILLGRIVRGEERQHGISQDIYEGHLTRYLLYPAPYLGMKYAEHLGSVGPGVLQAVAFAALATPFLPAGGGSGITAVSALGCAVLVGLGSFLYFLILYTVQAVAFWADNVWSLNVTLRFSAELLGGLMLPLSVFPAGAREVLGWLPFAHLFYTPTATLLGRVGVDEWTRAVAVSASWCAILLATGALVWRRGRRTYTGVGI